MMPLWTTAMRLAPSRWGWAFCSVGRPWVAQRVWPIPTVPDKGCWRRRPSSPESFPTLRRMENLFPSKTTTPAES